MKILIRECIKDDAQSIYLLNKYEMGYDYPVDKQIKKIIDVIDSEKDKIYVAVKDDKIVGYIHVNDYDVIYMDHLKNIMGIAVDSHYRKLGIGKKLLQQAEKWAKDTGASGVRLVSGESRTGAHEFYRHCGYESHKKQLNFIKMFK